MPPGPTQPLAHLRVVEFTHMLMGPAAGSVLADLGAEVIRVEPPGGDRTRVLPGSGAGYFWMFNRNKKSVTLDVKHPRGRSIATALAGSADILIENFKPGTMDRLGLGYEQLAALYPRLIYCSTKGFLSGPYEHRAALDEVAQMMGGLAYMTGPPGRPLRAGASVVDIMGGLFGAFAILAAVEDRHRTGRGQFVRSALYENVVYLMGQHLAQQAMTGEPAPPMPVRIAAWAVYDIFETADAGQVFVGVVSDAQWQALCAAFGLDEFAHDAGLAHNAGRVAARPRIMPVLQERFRGMAKSELMARLERIGLPFAPIARPQELWQDEHLLASRGLLPIRVGTGATVGLPALPVEFDGQRPALRLQPPRPGEHTREVLSALGVCGEELTALAQEGVIG